ncbi:MAG: hypothetical protein WCR96_07030 [Candidatus Methanomethylophilaceae archaeon]|jgi:hypothetical protein
MTPIEKVKASLRPSSLLSINPIDYAEKFVRIVTEDVPAIEMQFKRNPVQHYYHDWKNKLPEPKATGKRILVLKARRMGITTFEQALSYSICRTQRHSSVLTVAQTQEDVEDIFRMVHLMHEKDPNEEKLNTDRVNSLSYKVMKSVFDIKSAEGTAIKRGSTLSRAHCSEVSFWKTNDTDTDNLIAAIGEAARRGEVVLETTANGVGNYFHQLWTEAKAGLGIWTPCFLGWYLDPRNSVIVNAEEREQIIETLDDYEINLVESKNISVEQLAWRREKRKGSERKKKIFDQEYPSTDTEAFISSGGGYFDAEKLTLMSQKCKAPIFEQETLAVWQRPILNHDYIVAADTSEGNPGSDPSPIVVLDRTTGEQVLRNNFCVKPAILGTECVRVATEYNGAVIAVENNNTGHSVLNTIMNQEMYSNIFYADGDYDTPGWRTTAKTRPQLLENLDDMINDNVIVVNDSAFIQQALSICLNDAGKYETKRGAGHHGDLVMAWGIASIVHKLLKNKVTVPVFV